MTTITSFQELLYQLEEQDVSVTSVEVTTIKKPLDLIIDYVQDVEEFITTDELEDAFETTSREVRHRGQIQYVVSADKSVNYPHQFVGEKTFTTIQDAFLFAITIAGITLDTNTHAILTA